VVAAKIQQSDDVATGASYTTEGAGEIVLRNGTDDNIKLGAKFTQSGARTLHSALLKLKRNGALASGTLTLELYADSSGPTGSALATATLDLSLVGTSAYEDYLFEFTSKYELVNSTVYWLVLTADYTESATDNITWRQKASVGGAAGNSSIYDSSWSADTDKSFEFAVKQLSFADVSGLAFTALTATGAIEEINVWADNLSPWVRVYHTIGGTGGPNFYTGVTASYG